MSETNIQPTLGVELIKEIKYVASIGVEKLIKEITYIVSPTGRSIICELLLVNGYVVHGTSLQVNDQLLGKQYAYNSAKQKLWELSAFAVHDRIHRASSLRSPEGN